jgi:hypothetical protein
MTGAPPRARRPLTKPLYIPSPLEVGSNWTTSALIAAIGWHRMCHIIAAAQLLLTLKRTEHISGGPPTPRPRSTPCQNRGLGGPPHN